MKIEKVQLVGKRKGTYEEWKVFTGIRTTTVEQAKAEIRRRSDLLDTAFDFAIRVTTLEEYSERDDHSHPHTEKTAENG